MAIEEKVFNEQDFRSEIKEDHRPWGKFREYPVEGVGAVKIITVDPGGILSLQYHHHRAEYWVALDEGLEVEVDDKTIRPAPNEEIFIPRGAHHRLKGVGDKPARIMELWLGNSDESDIVRLEDKYGRS
ncbi:MAG: phosphomannose isomerase type II C-terminal cupin domain [Armatimonadetes bacterium]|nr:phosphomannose isomerase type II C-terminal cupin domain [Armatimonadota bacterium]